MRVALINHSGEISGAEVSLLGTAAALVQRGVRVLLVVPESGELAARARAAGHAVRTSPFPAPRMSRNPVRLAQGLLALVRGATRLARILGDERVDVVHANSVRAGLMASFGRPFHRRPVVWSVRDFLGDGLIGRGVRMVAGVGADAIIGNSDAITADFARRRRLRARSRTIYPTVPPEAFQTSIAGDFRRAWGVPPPARVVSCVGQIAPWKRVHDVIVAFRAVSAEDPEARLVVVGAPKFRAENRDYQHRLERLVEESGLGDRVVFTGHQDDIERVFRSVDVLVHAAEREPFGRVLVEAMAQGVAVVATADGGIPEIVRDGETGFLVALGDTDAMAKRTLDLLRDPVLRRRMGDRGRARASDCFRADRSVDRLLDVYRGALGRPA